MERKKILIVDDSKTALMMSQMILKKQAYDVLTAFNGREAVDKALSSKPDLILMDFVMPILNGIEALREIRSQEKTRAIPVIMVTTRGEAENVEAGYQSGCNDYITKPINSVELLAKVKNFIG